MKERIVTLPGDAVPSQYFVDENGLNQTRPRNVIIFGDTGVGKSSIINMLSGREGELEGDPLASVSSGARGETFGSVEYHKYLPRQQPIQQYFKVHDTAGINEAKTGKVTTVKAIENLWELLGKLGDGIHLVVLVFRGPRLITTCTKNYNLITTLTEHQVPVALIITGLEDSPSPDAWWEESKAAFDKLSMNFVSVACITATRGRVINKITGECVYDDAYQESIPKVERVLLEGATTKPLIFERRAFLERRLVDICGFFGLRSRQFNEALLKILIEYGIQEGEARKLLNKVQKARIVNSRHAAMW